MILLSVIDFTLPLKNPVLIFSLILFIILFAPILLNKLKIPYLIGLILAGAVIGPNGLNLMLRDSSIVLFGTVGLLYIMFLAGLDIDMADFKKNKNKSIFFGIFTFIVPMTLGILLGLFVLNYSLYTSILLASIFASHTLIVYPLISKLGVVKNRAVNVAIGGTMITDTLALMVLAIISGISAGEISSAFWIQLIISTLIFSAIVIFLFPIIGRWFFKKVEDRISQFIFVLGMVYFSAFLSEAAGLEAIIGAFLAGLSLNRLIPRTSPLLNRIEFVGNALFIPIFLIGVGMLIDYRAFFKDTQTLKVAFLMTATATLAKYIVSYITSKIFKYNANEQRLLFSLINAHVAAALAVVMVGYNIVIGHTELGEPIRLLNDDVLNGTIIMILITCTHASFSAQKGAQNLAIAESSIDLEGATNDHEERILIPINYEESVDELVNLSITVKSRINKNPLYALNVINTENSNADLDKKARKILKKASQFASSTDNYVTELLRYDINIANAITSVTKEHNITDLVLGLHNSTGISDSFLGNLTQGILNKSNITTLIYKPTQSFSTIQRHLVIIPDKAEYEIGFPFWLAKVWNIALNTGTKMIFYASNQTINYIKEIHSKHPIDLEFITFDNWDDFLIIARDMKSNDNIIVILSRRNSISYNNTMALIPDFLNKYFTHCSFILVYPIQLHSSVNENLNIRNNASMLAPLQENIDRIDEIGKNITRLFKRK